MVALLIMGSAILLVSCDGGDGGSGADTESMLSHRSDTLTMISAVGGAKQYRFHTPLMERYEYAAEPYMEFRRGIDVITYDSAGGMKSTLVADYAIFLEKQELWEAKGNVAATNEEGQKLETQQLFWNQKTRKVYSNVDSKVTMPGGDVVVGEGFESDEDFDHWSFRKTRGRVLVETDNAEGSGDGKPADTAPETRPAPAAPPQSVRPAPAVLQRENKRLF